MPAVITALAVPFARAQTAPSAAPDAATLAKYDKNHNGKLDPDEIAAMQADQKKPVPVESSEQAIELSPFQVTSDTKGYYATNTMSGTRFNSKLDDLASSISVVTKEQMSDFAMLDINDIFNYTGNTEGTGTYTDYSVDRNGSVSDNVQLNPTQANRIRGLAPANVSLGNIETMGRVPIDPLNIDAIEISRGPNANVFGLGNASGTVNQVAAAANLTRDRSQAAFRTDSYGGYRTSLDVNRIIFQDKLAIRGSAAFQRDEYQLKPSGTNTVRYNGMIKYRPFKTTTISASVYYYRMNGNRPNSLPPRDNVTYWVNSGQPTWDPTTQQIHLNGATVGTFTSTTYNGPDYFSATLLGATRSQLFIDQHGISYWAAPQGFTNATVLAGATTAGPTSGGTADRYVQTTGIAGATGTAAKPSAQPLFTTTPTLNDRNLYDWSSINLAAPNRLMDQTTTSNVQVEQLLLNTQRQTLVVQGATMREDSQRYQRNLIGIANDNGQSGQLEVDPNEKNIDGTPNPFFLRPFIGTDKPRTVWAPAKWDTYRAQIAYKLDLSQEPGALKWLGLHQLTAYDEYKYRINRQYSFREGFLDQKTWIVPGTYLGANASPTGTPANIPLTSAFLRYYVGDNLGHNVDYAPGEFKNGVYNFVWGNNVTNKFNSEPTTLGLVAADNSGATANSKQILKTGGAVWQR
ncbi:MAG: TonB-dependent receptor plug domain-containing protein, partial [Pseudomonadota bacterium]